MCILQDFEAITPNILARTIETVEGGGLVVLALKGMKSLKQLYAMTMDVHARYRTEAHQDVVPRFNERFILSLGKCESCLVIDDEFNVLPISGGKEVKQLPPPDRDQPKTEKERELDEIKETLQEEIPVGPLVRLARTVDQAKALLTFVEAIAEKKLSSTVTLTAARGRGKSAAMGVAIAAAVAHGYSNIFVTSPSPENLKTLFEFVFKAFDALDYTDHIDYTIIQSTNADWNKAIVRVNVHRQHRQTIQYIRPQDAHVLGQAELVVIDEAAAIPLPLVKKLLGPYLVFMSSTINGYEGTGRSLSLKLIKQLREDSASRTANGEADTHIADRSTGKAAKETSYGRRVLREITLSDPIRYAQGDAVEAWLNGLLCLDATLPRSKTRIQGCPDVSQCQLLNVNRDALFSFHPVSERFLQHMVALYVASHYKNSPDDLQLMSDAPSHELFVLVPPISEDMKKLPEPLCVIQVALEGQISRQSVLDSLGRGAKPSGDLIPWLVSQQFQDEEFASLSGARVVRIATNPEYTGMGYGSRALELLVNYYAGKMVSLSEDDVVMEDTMPRITDSDLENASLLKEEIKVREEVPSLFAKLEERKPPALDYVGVSYGLTSQLHKFWKKASFAPVYLRQTPHDLTGEHTCVMLHTLESGADPAWLGGFARDFHKRFLSLLSYDFRAFAATMALSIDESANAGARLDSVEVESLTKLELDRRFTLFDLKRLEAYAKNLIEYRVILDLVPAIADLYFSGRVSSEVKLMGVQKCILLAIGLQRKDLEAVTVDLPSLTTAQILPQFSRMMRSFAAHFSAVLSSAVEAEMSRPSGVEVRTRKVMETGRDGDEVGEQFQPLPISQDKEESTTEETALMKRKRELIDSLPLDK